MSFTKSLGALLESAPIQGTDPDGESAFDWSNDAGDMLSISANEEGSICFAFHIAGFKGKGRQEAESCQGPNCTKGAAHIPECIAEAANTQGWNPEQRAAVVREEAARVRKLREMLGVPEVTLTDHEFIDVWCNARDTAMGPSVSRMNSAMTAALRKKESEE